MGAGGSAGSAELAGATVVRPTRTARPRGSAPSPRPAARGPHAQLVALQRAAGNRAVSALLAERARPAQPAPDVSLTPQVVVQRSLTNDRTWDPVEPVTGQGTKVDAIVGPHHKYGSGPTAKVGFRPYDYTQLFSAATVGAAYCQGHLLNDNLGGPGAATAPHADENLTAFPQKPTNSDHNKAIEQWVKAAATGSWFRYVVSIGYSTDSAARLKKRLGGSTSAMTQAGIALTATTFTYASSLYATWVELVDSPGATNAAPTVKPGGISGTLGILIPSPMTFTKPATRSLEYPTKKVTWGHLPIFKGGQTSVRTGVLPPGGAKKYPPSPGRSHIMPERWKGIDDARADKAASGTGNAVYLAGHQHYGEGVDESRKGAMSTTRFGRGYLMGYKDFDDGIEHGRTNDLTAPPTGPKATVDAHKEFWAGVTKGKAALLTAPPTGNRAEIAGHAEYWEGVKHARSNPKTTPPAGKAAQKAGHDDYWAGLEHAQKSPKATLPPGNLAQQEAHKAYWDAAEKTFADLAFVPPVELAAVKGRDEVVEGMTFVRANARTTPHPTPTLVLKDVLAAYWKGVDFARTNAPPAAYAGKEAPAAAAVVDYRTHGVDLAAKDLATLTGAAPAGGGAREGFDDFGQGVEAARTGQAVDKARAGHERGWTDCAAGIAEGGAGTAPATRKDAGFAVGYLYGLGGATARAGAPAPTGTGTEDVLTAGGHTDYLKGLEAARTDRKGTKQAPRAAAVGFDEFLDGIAKAQAGLRTAPPATGSEARTAAWKEYWEGVDLARKDPPSTAYAGSSSAGATGHADYRAGADHAAKGLDTLTGPPPAGGGEHLGFDDYREGADAAKAGQVADTARVAHVRGWTDCSAGMSEGEGTGDPTRGDGGYASGFLYGRGAVTAREGKPAPTGTGVQDVLLGGGHADYLTGLAAARTDRTATRPAAKGAGLGFDEYLAGVAKAKAGTRTAPPPATSEATTAAWKEYWEGVDQALKDAPTTAYAGTSSAGAAGHADYRSGVDAARASFAALTGARPTTGGAALGFGDYADGVEERKAGVPVDAGRSGHVRGWQDCVDGMAAGRAAVDTATDQTIGGFVSGYLHAQGGAQARAGQPDVDPTTMAEAVRSTGHVAYTAGIAAARRDLGTPPARVMDLAAFDEFRQALTAARTAARGVPLASAGAAAVAAGTDYWQGVDTARANPLGTVLAPAGTAAAAGVADYRAGVQHAVAHPSGTQPPATTASAEGAADYWAGEAHALGSAVAPVGAHAAATGAFGDFWGGVVFARATLAQLQGAPPAGRVAGQGFAEYAAGVAARRGGQADVPARAAFSRGWTDYTAGEGDKRGGHLVAQQTHSGYVDGFQRTNAPVAKRGGDPLQSPFKKQHL
ncbi:hypothetical protein [Cellulomonas chitinilytica]|nr:hypothetical protein [Cellulomonas chitinilytica]